MTSREFIAAEAGNTDRIILYREGLFWKAYERSAFALCSQVRPLKPTRKVLKSLDGGDLVSVGFPSASESTTLGDLSVIERSDDRLTVSSPRSIDEREFTVWKDSIPIKTPAARPKFAAGTGDEQAIPVVDSAHDSFWRRLLRPLRQLFGRTGQTIGTSSVAEAPKSSKTTVLSAPAAVPADSPEASAQRIAQSLKNFNLADKTPMECMLFIAELKKTLINF